MEPYRFFVGTYTEDSASRGIYTMELDPSSGSMTVVWAGGGCVNPSFVDCRGGLLFAACEGDGCGRIASLRILPGGALEPAGTCDAPGAGTCYVAAQRSARFTYAANYASGNIFGCAVLPGGALGKAHVDIPGGTGSGVDCQRQEGPHAHSVNLTPDGRRLLAADLGADTIAVYAVDPATGALTPDPTQPVLRLPGGEGPRHLAFHPSDGGFYVVTELGNRVYHFRCAAAGWERASDCPAVPPHGEPRMSYAADLRLSPDGKFLYASNRGYDCILTYRLDGGGNPSPIDSTPSGGKTPRGFALSPDGRFLVAAHQDSDSLTAFARDARSGRLTRLPGETSVPKPVCVRFLED